MRWIVFAGMMVLGTPLAAQEADALGAWRDLTGAEISEALTGRVLAYGDKWQDFRASGRTLYFAGRESWGYWEVRGDAYCSQWPPSDLWACYGMQTDGTALRFVGDAGDVTDGVYKD